MIPPSFASVVPPREYIVFIMQSHGGAGGRLLWFKMFPSSTLLSSSCLNLHRVAKCLCHFQIRASADCLYKLQCNNYGSYLIIKHNGVIALSHKTFKWQCHASDGFHYHIRSFASVSQTLQQKQKPKPPENKDIIEAKEKPFGELSTAQKVAQVGKDVTYTGVVIVGIIVTGFMFYVIGRELFSGQSPSGIYDRAFKLCKKHEELTCAIGTPLKGYGELSSRGRRRHVSHWEYERDGVKYMRMQFYVEGPDGKGTVHLEAKQDEHGKYDFRYLFVELDEKYPRTFVIIDNR